ncbi:hypothetical protein PVAND_014022 [Polypedilum vanderplanki]|uniref:BEN domain-containing protein n=1 Tax=Polypedilum vanderplanki TaxID=319348 RepID=A0A9J6CRI2_POLVA|nr:hypothetical protein PVAND_014022 [Polypedilum vanderplanki]
MSLTQIKKNSPVNNLAKIKILEKEVRMLKEKINELSTENATLREINVKFQIENFNLQKKLTQLENSQEISEILFEDEQNTEEEIEDTAMKDETQKREVEELYEEVLYDNDADLDTEEYLDEDAYETTEEVSKCKETQEKKTTKRTYSETFECIEDTRETTVKKSKQKDDIEYEITIIDDEDELEDISNITDPKDAIKYIYKLASRKASLNRLKNIEKGKHKDSAFVSKVLDLVFDKLTLASSSAAGQKCQSKLHLPPKPALDQTKLDLCKKAFIFRLKSEDVPQEEKQLRLKSFLKLVNDKIQNSRKCVSRNDPKLFEI